MDVFEFAKNKFDEAYENFNAHPEKTEYWRGQMRAFLEIMEHEANRKAD